jgi:hypothetical protein
MGPCILKYQRGHLGTIQWVSGRREGRIVRNRRVSRLGRLIRELDRL